MGEIADYYIEQYCIEQATEQAMWNDYVETVRNEVESLSTEELIETILGCPKEQINIDRFPAWDIASRLKAIRPIQPTEKQLRGLRNRLIYYRTTG